MNLLPKYKKRTKKIIFFFSSITLLLSSFIVYQRPVGTDAVYGNASELNSLEQQMYKLSQTISNEESQLRQLNGKIQNSQSTISALQNIINQKQQLISEKQQQISLLQNSINDEQSQISDINAKINKLYSDFVQRAKSSYEINYVNPLMIALGNKSIQDTFSNLEYFATTRNEDSKIISDMKNNEYLLQQKLDDLTVQQTDLKNAQNDMENQKSSLAAQQSQLQSQISYYRSSTYQIQHQLTADQQRYQSIVDQLNSLQVSSFGGGNGCKPGNWWYYNQNCYGRISGMYGTSIDMKVGCLITSIAMVATYEAGPLYNPAYVASRTYFDGYGDMMAWPDLPVGPQYIGNGSLNAINNQLAQGNPVIVYLAAPNGQHWVVFYQNLGGGDYMIKDPWYGDGLRFLGSNGHEYYSDYQIGASYILK